ncbi:hypothetical protein M5M_18637 [Simiduia agarivorans SA1 = DSM 21679]|uniref:Uncharacterized protein n=1 Tax=Simiduia agarivorans (strain DSM 21679 / JCM 13881 / BCRC 17597 / SA1) TaxID=1117647 RepID=R9S6A7_SIMAS|nr:hypothetical protein M5M_18637 [Simiduia agarivorans SA1 = DSM 21679]
MGDRGGHPRPDTAVQFITKTKSIIRRHMTSISRLQQSNRANLLIVIANSE